MMNGTQRHKSLALYSQLMRLHRPVGIWLVMWPCLWGTLIAFHPYPPLEVLVLFIAGAAITRSAGCIINDLADQKFDRKVARTKNRPLASGALTIYDALALLAFLLSLALLVAYALNPALIAWGALAIIPIILYPLMKRITWWPQAFLGMTFNLGVLFAWGAAHRLPDAPAFLLYAASLCWTIGYDTIYGHQDKIDDAAIGVKSTALRFNTRPRRFIALWYVLMLLCLTGVGVVQQFSVIYFSGLIVCAIHLIWQIRVLNPEDPISCLKVFKSNQWLGAMIFLLLASQIHLSV